MTDQSLDRRQNRLDNHLDSSRVRVNAVALIVMANGRDILKKKRIERHLVLPGQFGVELIKFMIIIGAEIARRTHSGQQHSDFFLLQAGDDRRQIFSDRLRRQPAQGVVGAEFDNNYLGSIRQRPIEPGEAAGGGITGDPRVDYQNVVSGRLQRLLQLCRKRFVFGETVASGQAVAKNQNS